MTFSGLEICCQLSMNQYPLIWWIVEYRRTCIAHFEMYNVLVAFTKWAKYWKGKTVTVRSDSMAVVYTLNNLAARDKFFAACIRSLLMISAKHNIHYYMLHIPGVWNTRADALSRLVIDWDNNKWALDTGNTEEVDDEAFKADFNL